MTTLGHTGVPRLGFKGNLELPLDALDLVNSDLARCRGEKRHASQQGKRADKDNSELFHRQVIQLRKHVGDKAPRRAARPAH